MQPNRNFIITETDETKQKCTAVLLNFLQHARKLSIGQCITSSIFEMNCSNLGHCRWILIAFPAGQYEFGKSSGQLSVYLKMVQCEHKKEKLLVDVKFFIGSEEKLSKIVKASTFQYSNVRTRWVGANLTNTSAFYDQSNDLMRDNDLVIGCRMIHSTVWNDKANDVEFKRDEMLTHQHKNVESTKTDVLSSSRTSSSLPRSIPSVIQSQVSGMNSMPPSATSTFQSVFPWHYSH